MYVHRSLPERFEVSAADWLHLIISVRAVSSTDAFETTEHELVCCQPGYTTSVHKHMWHV